jgi:hypothetical protein
MMTSTTIETSASFAIAPVTAFAHLVLEHDPPATIAAAFRAAAPDMGMAPHP